MHKFRNSGEARIHTFLATITVEQWAARSLWALGTRLISKWVPNQDTNPRVRWTFILFHNHFEIRKFFFYSHHRTKSLFFINLNLFLSEPKQRYNNRRKYCRYTQAIPFIFIQSIIFYNCIQIVYSNSPLIKLLITICIFRLICMGESRHLYAVWIYETSCRYGLFIYLW